MGGPPLSATEGVVGSKGPGEGASGGRAPSGDLGRVSLGFLAVSVLTGLMLAPFWSAQRPLESLETLEGGLPWGFFLRGLHAFSSFGLLVTLAGHLLEVIGARAERQLSPALWWRSTLLLPLAVLALLSGFVLRGDAEAAAALAVWRRVLESMPALGAELSRLTLGVSPGDPGCVALHHAGTLTLLLWLFTAEHGSRLLPDVRSAVLAALASIALAGVFPLALGSPEGATTGAGLLLGPWYLLGLQGALVDLPVAAGWLLPLAPVALIGLLRHVEGAGRRRLLAGLAVWLLAYLGFTVRVLLLARSG